MIRFHTFLFLVLATGLLAGCSDANEFEDYSDADLSENDDTPHGHEGEHGGHILELGDTHAFHAELVFDSATRDITVYFYGDTIGTAQAAADFMFELESGDEETELAATASPLEGETDEDCSRYTIAGAGVPASITSEEKIDGHFHVTLAGSEYVGELHAHSHGDAHDHDEHAGHDKDDDHDHDHDESHADGDDDTEHKDGTDEEPKEDSGN
jgi:hypothetical protein